MTEPVSCSAIKQTSSNIQTLHTKTIINRLIEDTNTNINECVLRGLSSYSLNVPSIIFGYPAFSASEVAQALKECYGASGFKTRLRNTTLDITWS